jgi:hypothetical protein
MAFVFAFAFTNGVHDASNAIATLVATRAASPGQAMLLAAVFNTLGPLLVGAAVADTIGGIVAIDGRAAVEVIGAGLVAAVAWNALTWWLVTPLEPEALYALSRGSDEVLNQAKDAVRESEVMACPPDAALPKWPPSWRRRRVGSGTASAV